MGEKGSATVAELRAQARRCRSLASGLLPGDDKRRLQEIAVSLEAEASGAVTAERPPYSGGRVMAEA
jgi:hypothetical protein